MDSKLFIHLFVGYMEEIGKLAFIALICTPLWSFLDKILFLFHAWE